MTRSSRQELISEGPSRGPEKSKESLAAERVPGAAGERDWFRFLVLLFKDCVTVPTILTRSGRQELISEGPSRGPEKSKEGLATERVPGAAEGRDWKTSDARLKTCIAGGTKKSYSKKEAERNHPKKIRESGEIKRRQRRSFIVHLLSHGTGFRAFREGSTGTFCKKAIEKVPVSTFPYSSAPCPALLSSEQTLDTHKTSRAVETAERRRTMKYEEFKSKVKEALREEYPDWMIQEKIIYKVNMKKETLMVRPEKAENLAIPNIYLEDFYEIFQQDQDFQKAMQAILYLLQRYTRKIVDPFSQSLKKENIIIELISQKQNQELLRNIPYTPFQDLACVYRYILRQDESGMGTMLLTDDLVKVFSLASEELHDLAMKNTKEKFSFEVMRLSEMLYAVTSATREWGATALIFPETLAFLGEKIKENFYILPTSIHEFMAVPQKDCQVEELLGMLKEGNQTLITKNEFLSSSIYHYDIRTKQLKIVANYDV